MASGRLVYQWTDHGFFSEMNYMLLAILYCRQHGREFVLSSRYAPVFHSAGWRDFFRPFCHETDDRLLHFLDSRPLHAGQGLKARLSVLDKRVRRYMLTKLVQPLFYSDVTVVAQAWDALRELRRQKEIVLPFEGVPRCCSLREALRLVNKEIWQYNDDTAAAIETSIAHLSLPVQYAALHVRRGDKTSESDSVGEITYISQLERATALKAVYVATDDYRCVETVRRLRPGWQLWSLCPTEARGYFPEDFDSQPPEERGRRTLLLLIETEIMTRAEVLVGTFSSGIGTYQGIVRSDRTYGVDYAEWIFEGGL